MDVGDAIWFYASIGRKQLVGTRAPKRGRRVGTALESKTMQGESVLELKSTVWWL
jgi:hypothetical protein